VTQVAGWPPQGAAPARAALPAPPGGAQDPGPDTEPQAPLSDTMERMLRPQGLFQNRQPVPAEWQQQAYQPAPGGQYPQPNPYQQGVTFPPPGAQYPPAGQHPPDGGFQQPAPPAAPAAPAAWGSAPATAPPPGPGQPGPGQPAPGFPPGGGYAPGEQPTQAAGFPAPYGNGSYAPGQFPPGQPAPGQLPGMQFGVPEGGIPPRVTGADRAAAMAGGGVLRSLPLLRNGKLLAAGGAVLAVIVIAAIYLSTQGGSAAPPHGGALGATAAPTTSAATATGAGTGAPTPQSPQAKAAATALSALLAQSGGDRADVGAAVVSVETCGKTLPQAAAVFARADANRQALLTKLAALPNRSALPTAMVATLTGAWQASQKVDADLTKWAQAEAAHCVKPTTKNANYTATIPFDSQATNDKDAFVQAWNPIAQADGLPTRQSGDL
jgi:hypothetical protein